MSVFREVGFRANKDVVEKLVKTYDKLDTLKKVGLIENCKTCVQVMPYIQMGINTMAMCSEQAVNFLPERVRERLATFVTEIEGEIMFTMREIIEMAEKYSFTWFEILLGIELAIKDVLTILMDNAFEEFTAKDMMLTIVANVMAGNVKTIGDKVEVKDEYVEYRGDAE